MATEYEVMIRQDIVFAEHDEAQLLGDLYLPKGLDKALVDHLPQPVGEGPSARESVIEVQRGLASAAYLPAAGEPDHRVARP
jgi:hypothetical protein